MRKLYLLLLFLFLNSCESLCFVEDSDTQEATRLYNSLGTHLADFNEYQNRYLFGDCYNPRTDRVFVYESFYSKKYILERYGKPFTYSGRTW
jgi:hypothetical protein